MDQLIVVSDDNVVELPFVTIITRKKISIQKTATTTPVSCYEKKKSLLVDDSYLRQHEAYFFGQ